MTTAHLIEKSNMRLSFIYLPLLGTTNRIRLILNLNLGRPGIIAIRIGRGVVRIHVATGTIRIVSIAAKTSSRPIDRYFSCLSRFGGLGPNAGLAWRRQAMQM